MGQALINRDALEYPHWGIRDNRGSASREVRKQEQPLEKAVSKTVGEMDVLWLAVDDPPGPGNRRGWIERHAIALLSNHAREVLDPPSTGWLGRACPRDLVTRSGLWNQRHAEERHDSAFLPELERLVEGHERPNSAGTRTNPAGSRRIGAEEVG